MALTDLTILSSLKTKLHWHQARQKVLAENVANANTVNFKPRELVDPPAAGGTSAFGVVMAQTSPMHIAAGGGGAGADTTGAARFETRPSGSSVNLEDEMLKSSANQSDYQLAASLYQKSLSMLRSAAGVRGA